MESRDECPEISCETFLRKRGVKRGSLRGSYMPTGEEKRRVLAAVESGNWKSVAVANGVPVPTAYGWIRRADEQPRQRGGCRVRKIEERHVEKLLDWLSSNPLLTLVEMKNMLKFEFELDVSTTTIHKHLHGKMFTLKKAISEPHLMNSLANKRKRAEYVQALMSAIGEGRRVIYIDESNCNLFLRRQEGRSKKGSRCIVKCPTGRGKNVHILGAVSQTGIVFWERRRGSYKKEDCCDWLRRLLRQVIDDIQNVVIVCDNAPVHVDLERVMEEPEFLGAALYRAAPYSAPLNPIEECWSVMKSAMKRHMAQTSDIMLSTPDGITQTEHRLQYLENAIDRAMLAITPLTCLHAYNHVQKHFPRCLEYQDLVMGDNIVHL